MKKINGYENWLWSIVVHNSVLEMCLKEMTVLIVEKLIASVCTLATLCLFFTSYYLLFYK